VERLVPRDLSTLVADESVLVVGRLTGDMPRSIRLTTPAGEETLRVLPERLDDRGDLQARWATGRLHQMLADGIGRAALVDLGVRSGIITPFTSLYVPTKGEMTASELEELREKQRRGRSRGRGASLDPEDGSRFALSDLPFLFAGCSKLESMADQAAPSGAEPESVPAQAPAPVAAAEDPRPSSKTVDLPTAEPAEEETKRGPAEAKGGAKRTRAKEIDKAKSEPWGRDDSLGSDPVSAKGNMRGDGIAENDDSGGFGALGLTGTGEGGGGKDEATGLGDVETSGHGAGTGTGQGFGSGHGRLGGSHRTRAPRVRMGATQVTGRLPPEVIQRIVRQSYGRFRLCYEKGLRNNPNLEGKISVRFVIGRDGRVSNVGQAGTDLPDARVVSCVVNSYRGLTFPEPEGGVVTVTYPIMFTPGGGKVPDAVQPPRPSVHVTVNVGKLPHNLVPCDRGSVLPFARRVRLWRERLTKAGANPQAVAQVYQRAIAACEAPTWRGRAKLRSMMLDALPTVTKRVQLWRIMQAYESVADALYRGILKRVRKPEEMRELHQALGLKSVDPGLLDETIDKAKDPAERVEKLRALRKEWPKDFTLALRLLEALEDAGDDPGARDLGRSLRERPDADAHVLTEVGELHLRLADRAESEDRKARDVAEARRTFGEIVEYAPDEPIARRRLGDLLRAHGWYEEAARQYETLARLSPDDQGLLLLHAATAQGLGKLDEAVRWADKVSQDGAPGNLQGLARTARALAGVYLAWGRVQAKKESKPEEVALLRKRTERLLDQDDRQPGSVRVVLLWSHPELHPTLWSNALGSMMPAPEGDVTLGISQVIVPKRDGAALEVRMEERDAKHAARLGAEAVLTVIFDEGRDTEKVVRLPVTFIRGGPSTLRFTIEGTEVKQ